MDSSIKTIVMGLIAGMLLLSGTLATAAAAQRNKGPEMNPAGKDGLGFDLILIAQQNKAELRTDASGRKMLYIQIFTHNYGPEVSDAAPITATFDNMTVVLDEVPRLCWGGVYANTYMIEVNDNVVGKQCVVEIEIEDNKPSNNKWEFTIK